MIIAGVASLSSQSAKPESPLSGRLPHSSPPTLSLPLNTLDFDNRDNDHDRDVDLTITVNMTMT